MTSNPSKTTKSFNIYDYVVPRVAGLIDLGESKKKTKGGEFEKLVSEAFSLLEFEVEYLGQGRGRKPDAIAKFREDNTAFIIDAKAYSGGYVLGTDDRALYEYVDNYCPKLRTEGLKRIAFVIVSNSFKSDNRRFVHEITWKSDVRRFVFITSGALLHLLAYKTRNNIPVRKTIEFLTATDSIITEDKVIGEFGE
jgi:hypothetical protein